MAVLKAINTNDIHKDSITIDRQLSDYYLKALLAVYNSTSLPARDTVVQLNITKDWFPLHLNMIGIEADTTQQWVKNIRAGVFPCGHTGMDSIIQKYYLVKDWGAPYGALYKTLFKTDSNCFMGAMANKLLTYFQSGLTWAAPDGVWGFGADITDSTGSNYLQLTFDFGWEDCIAGCIHHRYWVFRVYDYCMVEYKTSYGDALPPNFLPVSLVETKRAASQISAYPNPVAGGVLLIKAGNALVKKITITNLLGQKVAACEMPADGSIDISRLPPASYFVEVESTAGREVIKVIRE